MTDPKSSISSLPSFSPVLIHLLGCKPNSQPPSFHRHPAARTQTWADSPSLQSCSFPWAPFWPAFLEVKQATRPGVSPSSPLLYRPEEKEMSARRGRKRGVVDAASPLWISSGKWAVELQYIFWLSKSINMCSAFNKIIPPHFTKSWISSLRLSIPSLYLVSKCHLG